MSYRTKSRRRPAPLGFKVVGSTDAELADYRASHHGSHPYPIRRLECLVCGLRLWGSGLAVGSHRRVCSPTNAMLAADAARTDPRAAR